jgi:hypothetical protein
MWCLNENMLFVNDTIYLYALTLTDAPKNCFFVHGLGGVCGFYVEVACERVLGFRFQVFLINGGTVDDDHLLFL